MLLVEKSLEKRPVGRPRRRWADNIKMDLTETDCDDWRWIGLAKIVPNCEIRHYKC
jgi:hypothetical protein